MVSGASGTMHAESGYHYLKLRNNLPDSGKKSHCSVLFFTPQNGGFGKLKPPFSYIQLAADVVYATE